jgi:hypothetical protein
LALNELVNVDDDDERRDDGLEKTWMGSARSIHE